MSYSCNSASGILEDLMEVIRATRSLNRKFLHLLIKEQLLSLNLSLGIGEVYYALTFLPRCKVRLWSHNFVWINKFDRKNDLKFFISTWFDFANLYSFGLTEIARAELVLFETCGTQADNEADPEPDISRYFEPDDDKHYRCGRVYVFEEISESSEIYLLLLILILHSLTQILDMISFHCPHLVELNLTSTMITDEGLISLCGLEDGRGCKKLQRLIVTETRCTWIGALTVLQHLPITDFDFDKIFQVNIQLLFHSIIPVS